MIPGHLSEARDTRGLGRLLETALS